MYSDISDIKNLSDASFDLFVMLATDAPNWNGSPLVCLTRGQRGNLTQLKTEGLLTTFKHEGETFAEFTEKGRELAKKCGIELK